MSLKTNRELLTHAKENGYAVGAFNVNNLEQVLAVIEAAEEEKAPAIIAVSEGALKYAGDAFFFEAVPRMAREASVPLSVHLDHGKNFDFIVRCVVGGFSSVMFDGSSLPFDENVSMTKRVVEIAHPAGISVEGEIGHVGGSEIGVDSTSDEELLTVPGEALEFVKQTGIDNVAVAIGTVHGMRKQTARLDLERLEQIASVVPVPIVLHGASGVPDEIYPEVIKRGIHKINIGTELQKTFSHGIRSFVVENENVIDPRKIIRPGINEMKVAVKTKINLFLSNGKAW
ncbi:MAG TPA: class II fructose-bisphosphate aldolase family protein [bacterium]|nr:class II fructose-bisphosphate aldolase family protein [bacterium]